jgi:hypothetical protein
MSDNSVVVNINQFDRSRRSPVAAETLSILHASRDLLIEGASRVLTRHAEAMEGALLAMAERAPLMETRNACHAAQALLGKQVNELLSACKDAYCTAFNNVVQGRDRSAAIDLSKLSLVDDEDFEITLAIDKATSRLRFNCAEELVALDARVGHLLGRSDLSENENPLGPRALCDALLDGITRMQAEAAARVMLLNQFDLVLTTELAEIYQSINHHLIDHNILPDLKAGSKKRAPAPGATRSAAAAASPAAPQPQADSEMLRLFEQMARGSGGGASHAGLPGVSLLDSLNQLQGGGLTLPDGGRFELPVLEAATVHNVLRTLQQSAVMQAASPLDAVLVDAVAMLFDVLFDEPGIPDRLKAQIGRLQIPVLKAAMLDRAFFSQPDHPVRRMLDAIATFAVYLGDTPAGNARLEAISRVISGVLEHFEQDIGVFDAAAAELQAMGATLENSLDQAADLGLQAEIARIKRGERIELAPVIVGDIVKRTLKDQPVAEAVRDFLLRHWAQLLTTDYVDEGEQSAHFNSHVETMRELVWSVQPKADMDARLMLVRILPGLLKRLREGVAEIGVPHPAAERFFASLVILHANSVRPNAQPVPLPELTPEEIEEMTAPSAQAAAAESVQGEPALPEIEDAFTEQARALAKGDWVEFHYEDGTFRWARLGWVSGMKNTYLFSDRDGMSSFSIGLHRLADKLRNGEAVLVERKSITESAFGKLMKLFRQKLGA